MEKIKSVQKVKVRYLVLKEMEVNVDLDDDNVEELIADKVTAETSPDNSILESFLWTAKTKRGKSVVDLSDVKMSDLIKHFDV
jgi:hypothetical protein